MNDKEIFPGRKLKKHEYEFLEDKIRNLAEMKRKTIRLSDIHRALLKMCVLKNDKYFLWGGNIEYILGMWDNRTDSLRKAHWHVAWLLYCSIKNGINLKMYRIKNT